MSSALGQNSSCTEAQGRRSTLESGLGRGFSCVDGQRNCTCKCLGPSERSRTLRVASNFFFDETHLTSSVYEGRTASVQGGFLSSESELRGATPNSNPFAPMRLSSCNFFAIAAEIVFQGRSVTLPLTSLVLTSCLGAPFLVRKRFAESAASQRSCQSVPLMVEWVTAKHKMNIVTKVVKDGLGMSCPPKHLAWANWARAGGLTSEEL